MDKNKVFPATRLRTRLQERPFHFTPSRASPLYWAVGTAAQQEEHGEDGQKHQDKA
jgi:hypothetical protein